MGAGKSTVGRLLGPLLGWRFVDADAVVAEHAGAPIAELFSRYGEPWFREREAAAIEQLLTGENLVLALGGGAVEHPGTRTLLATKPETLVVYLEAPLAISLARCAAEPGAALRPVLENTSLLENRFQTRIPLYRAAHRTIATEGRTPAELAATIREHVFASLA